METEDQLDALFFALSDRRRRQLLAELAAGPRAVTELAALARLQLSATSKHVAVLAAAGLLFKTRRGRAVVCHLNFDAWRSVTNYVAMHAKFWAGRLDELESFLKEAGAD